MSHLTKVFPTSFEKFYGDNETSDIIIVLNSKEYNLHRLVLALHSDVFKKLLYSKKFSESESKKLVLENNLNVSDLIFKNFIKCLYTNKITINQNNVVKLYELSDFYQIGHLKKMCIKSLYEEIKNGDYFPALEMVNKYYDEELLRLCMNVISRTIHNNLEHFCKNVSFQSLKKVINNDHFNVGEEIILKIADTYIEINGDENANDIYKCIRFHLMKGEDIVKYMKPLVEKGYVDKDYLTECLVYKFDSSKCDQKLRRRRIGFMWNSSELTKKHDCFIVYDQGRKVRRKSTTGVNPSVRTNIPLSSENPFFQAKLERFCKWNCFGVCEKSFSLIDEFIGNDKEDSGFGIYIGSTTSNCYEKNNSNCAIFEITQKIIKQGDILGLKYNEDDNSISYFVNNYEIGRGILKHTNRQYYPAVSMGYDSIWAIV